MEAKSLTSDDKKIIYETTEELGKSYPFEYALNCKASLWGCGLRANKVSEELYDKARAYYGRLWTYTGD